ncbi:MAG: secondary thiamine-phosphate synthase enzyme YjbQ [Candidatus Aenigmatarchaeota archaeon]
MSMEVETYRIEFSTSEKDEVKNLTSELKEKVRESDIQDGMCLIFAPHATGVLILNENETGVKEDYLKGLYDIVPENNDWSHDQIDNNAHSHVKSAFVGTDRVVPVTDGKLDLGTWQSLFFLETDGPRRKRRLVLKLMGKTE